jgi:hypothetical protein
MEREPETLQETTDRLRQGIPRVIVEKRKVVHLHLDAILLHCQKLRDDMDEWIDAVQKLLLALDVSEEVQKLDDDR